MTENPFGGVAVDEVEDLDVETLAEDVAEDTAEVPAPPTAKAPKAAAKKSPARPTVPEGYIMPVAFARELTKHLAARGASNKHGKIDPETNSIPPQQIYSMMRTNAADSKHPFPVHEVVGFSSPVLILSEALAWWDEKDTRVAKGKAEKAEKAKKKAEKAETATTEVPGVPAEEASAAVVEVE
jgi:hypothetical protein